MKKNLKNKKGFTLVEIIVVLVILAIMAGFAIPAYNGFVERARESEILADARVLLIAAQTAGQERAGLKGTPLVGDADDAHTTDEGKVQTAINSYSGLPATTYFEVNIDGAGKVTGIVVTKGLYTATLSGTEWTVVKNSPSAATAQIVYIPA